MILDGIGIRNNSTGLASVYLPRIHSLINTPFKQDEKVKYGYKINVGYTEDQILNIESLLENKFNDLENKSLNTTPDLGFCIITNECNMDCSFCFADKNSIYGDTFNIEWIKKLKDVLPENSFKRVSISGGEPLLFFDKVKMLQEEFGYITIYTNGSLINEDISLWAIKTNTKFHIALDYSIENFEGHDSASVRENIDILCAKYPELKKLIEIAITYPADKISEFDKFRNEQKKSFEKDLDHEINYISANTDSLSYETFNDELDRVESKEIKLEDSIFNRQVRYVDRTIKNYINVESCSPNITLNFQGDITSCFTNGSNITSKYYDRFVISNIDNFTLDKYFEYTIKTKKRGLCKNDCPAKYFCGNICWANIDSNNFNCIITKNSLFHVLYLELNYSNMDLTNEINFTRIEFI